LSCAPCDGFGVVCGDFKSVLATHGEQQGVF
jgi:hypothetical protein